MYLPSRKQTLYYYRKQDVWFYDYAANKWSSTIPEGPTPSTEDYEGLLCHDTRRDRIYVFNDKQKTVPWIYDVAANVWVDPKPTGQPATAAGRILRSASALVHYNTVGDAVLFFQVRQSENVKRGYYIYDVAANTWTTQLRPFPEAMKLEHMGWNGFYDAKLNAHFFHIAGDSRTNGTIWVYRYKRESGRIK